MVLPAPFGPRSSTICPRPHVEGGAGERWEPSEHRDGVLEVHDGFHGVRQTVPNLFAG